MKLKTNTLAALSAISSLAAFGLLGQSKAAVVVWDPVQQVTGTSNMIATNTGLSVAYGSGGAIVNGVTFAEGSLSGNTQNGISMSISGFSDIHRSTYTTNLADVTINGRVPSGMNELLRGGANNTGAAATVTLSGLTNGQEYEVQFLVGDYRNESQAWGFIPRHETITSGNTSGQLNYLNNTSGPASYVIGRFTADENPQVFTFTPNESAQLNAIAVVPIPEPSAAVIGGLGFLALLRRRRA